LYLKNLDGAAKNDSATDAQALMRQANVRLLRRKPTEAAELTIRSHSLLVEKTKPESALIARSAFDLIETLLNADRRQDADAIGKKQFTLELIGGLPSEKERLQYRSNIDCQSMPLRPRKNHP
jgi:hypothetical protein